MVRVVPPNHKPSCSSSHEKKCLHHFFSSFFIICSFFFHNFSSLFYDAESKELVLELKIRLRGGGGVKIGRRRPEMLVCRGDEKFERLYLGEYWSVRDVL